jgi:hypothetical protein
MDYESELRAGDRGARTGLFINTFERVKGKQIGEIPLERNVVPFSRIVFVLSSHYTISTLVTASRGRNSPSSTRMLSMTQMTSKASRVYN